MKRSIDGYLRSLKHRVATGFELGKAGGGVVSFFLVVVMVL